MFWYVQLYSIWIPAWQLRFYAFILLCLLMYRYNIRCIMQANSPHEGPVMWSLDVFLLLHYTNSPFWGASIGSIPKWSVMWTFVLVRTNCLLRIWDDMKLLWRRCNGYYDGHFCSNVFYLVRTCPMLEEYDCCVIPKQPAQKTILTLKKIFITHTLPL